MLDAYSAIALLVGRGLVDPVEVVDGELQIVDVSRRNRDLRVLRSRGPSYMIKQGLGMERRASVAHEVAVYDYLQSLDDGRISGLLPPVVAYSADDCALVLELVERGESLDSHHFRHRRFSVVQGRRLAEALLAVHRATSTPSARPSAAVQFEADVPWVLCGLHRPGVSLFGELSNGGMLAIQMIQTVEGFTELLDAAAEEWTPCCLVHGDLRFDNCVVAPGSPPAADPAIKLVDWELASFGDPCWDVGAVLASYLCSWLLSCPISGETAPEAVIHLGRYRLADMRRAAGAFWATYSAGMPPMHAVSLQRTMRFAAVKVLQCMLEELQPSVALTGRAVCLAQLAFNILNDPNDAAAQFLATPIER